LADFSTFATFPLVFYSAPFWEEALLQVAAMTVQLAVNAASVAQFWLSKFSTRTLVPIGAHIL
jgi:hypothetical protein